ncbi:MAG: hypothetical protein ISN29_07895, partial [Gammaproteobacteria bacterium AqS3]|nr:hypothetical protein [Gammaproteobacteria bacterium AqS3]
MSHCLADIFCLCQRLLLPVGVLFLGLAFSVPVHGQNRILMEDIRGLKEGYFEKGSTVSTKLWLSHQPTDDVTVIVSTLMRGVSIRKKGVINSKIKFIFTPQSWNESNAQQLTISNYTRTDDEIAIISMIARGGGYDNQTRILQFNMADMADNDNTLLVVPAYQLGLDVAKGTDGSFSVRLRRDPAQEVVVRVRSNNSKLVTVDTNANIDGNQDTLTFSPENWYIFQTVTFMTTDDVDRIRSTRIVMRLPNDESKSIYIAIHGDYRFIRGMTFSPNSLVMAEGSSRTFTVKLTSPTRSDVIVILGQPNNTDVTVDADPDMPGLQTTLTFTTDNWHTPQTVTVSAAEDADLTLDNALISLAADGGNYLDVPGSMPVVVVDNDMTGLKLSLSSLTLNEGGSGSFTVELKSRPSVDVTVTLRQPDNTDVTVDETTLIFTVDNWDTAQEVEVSAAQDDDAVDDSATIKLSASGGGYDDVTGSVEVEVEDDDTTALTITADDPFKVDEGGEKTFTVQLATRPSADVTVELRQDSETANDDVTLDKTSLGFTVDNWNKDQTVTVSAAVDDDAVNDSATIILTAAGGDYGGVTGSVSVTVDDTDEATLIITPAEPLKVKEEDSAPFRVKLAAQPSGDVTVQLAQPDNTDVTVDVDPDAPGNQTKLAFTADT